MRRLTIFFGFMFLYTAISFSYAAYLWYGTHPGGGSLLALAIFQTRFAAHFYFAATVGAIATCLPDLPVRASISKSCAYLMALLICMMLYQQLSQRLPPEVMRSPVLLVVINVILAGAFVMTTLVP